MEEVVAPIDGIVFDIERDLDEQIGALPLPFIGMDKSGAATCVFHMHGSCVRGQMCPFRHIKPDRTVVCKHWLRGLCKKGDSCEFLHEYDMSKMPECYFYSKFRACANKECPFLHIDPESKVKDCPWFDRGFCRHGPSCRHRHARRVTCINYLCGFCPEGSNCKFVHMKFDIPVNPAIQNFNENANLTVVGNENSSGSRETANTTITSNIMMPPMVKRFPGVVICHYCNQPGHKIYTCNQIPSDQKDEVIEKFLQQQQESRQANHQNSYFHRPENGRRMENGGIGGPGGPPGSHMSSGTGPTGQSMPFGAPPGGQSMPFGAPRMPFRPLDQVVCFKCNNKGHYANKCPKGHLAFLSSALKDLQPDNLYNLHLS